MTRPAPAGAPSRTHPVFVVGTVLALVLVMALTVLNGSLQHSSTAYVIGQISGTLALATAISSPGGCAWGVRMSAPRSLGTEVLIDSVTTGAHAPHSLDFVRSGLTFESS